MLFRLTEGSLFEDNPVIKTMKEFSGVTEQQMKFVIMYADWMSPYRNLVEEERKSRALDYAGLDTAEGLEDYILAYYDMQGVGVERQSIDAVDAGLNAIREQLKTSKDKDPAEIQKLVKSLTELTKERRNFVKYINDTIGNDSNELALGDNESAVDTYHG